MYWQLSFYGSIFGAYIMYHYVKKNLPTILFIMGKSEAYYIIMKRYCTSFFCSNAKNKISNRSFENNNLKIQYIDKDNTTLLNINNNGGNNITKYKFEVLIQQLKAMNMTKHQVAAEFAKEQEDAEAVQALLASDVEEHELFFQDEYIALMVR